MLFTLYIYLGTTIVKTVTEHITLNTIYSASLGIIITILILYYLKREDRIQNYERI